MHPEHYREHKNILKISETCRVYDFIGATGTILAFYRIGSGPVPDHQFMIRYGVGGPGDITLYYHHASFDNVKTLRELLSL